MISGRYVKSFKDANLAVTVDVHMNSDVPKWTKFELLESGKIKLLDKKYGECEAKIYKDKNGSEYTRFGFIGVYEKLVGQRKATVYKVYPFLDKNH